MYTLIILIIVNIAGYLLRSGGYDRFFIFMGFRFHLALVIPALIFFKNDFFSFAKKSLTKPEGSRYLISFLGVLPLCIVTALLYYFKITDVADPDYFYELGLSSFIDYPVYLFWNLPQLIILGLFLKNIAESGKYRFPLVFLVLLSLFAYEFVPLPKTQFSLPDVMAYVPAVFLFAMIISRFRDIYLFAASLFTVLWGFILVFGTKSETLIRMLLAAQYDEWTGFFSISKNYADFLMPGFFVVVILFSIVPLLMSFGKNR